MRGPENLSVEENPDCFRRAHLRHEGRKELYVILVQILNLAHIYNIMYFEQ